MFQNSLFKNIPALDQSIRERNKAILQKAKGQGTSAKPTTTVRSSNKLYQTIQLIKQTAAERLKEEEGKYLLIRNEKDLVEYVDKVIDIGIAALDTETTGLDPIDDKLVGTCLYAPGLQGCYIPHAHTDMIGTVLPDQIPYELMAREMQRMVDSGVKFVLHNAKFDLRVIVNGLGVWFTPYWDTNIASNFLNENEPHGLKYLHKKYVLKDYTQGEELNTFDSLFEGISFNYVPIEIGYLYAAKDPVMTYELYEFQKPYLTPDNEACKRQNLVLAADLYKWEVELIRYVAEMEQEGVYIDEELAKKLSEEFRQKMKESALRANDILKTLDFSCLPQAKRDKLRGPIEVGDELIDAVLNIGSPTQLAIVLYDVLKLKSPDGSRGTGEEILEALASQAEDGMVKDLVKEILAFRGYKKLLSTYIDKMPAVVKEKTGKLHGQFNQYGAKTGRFSSSDPNLQNIPSGVREIRQMFKPGEGYVFIGSDFSQQEPRVLAHLCYVLFGDDRMMNAYKTGKDLYSWTASEVYQVPYEECKEFYPDGTKNPEGKERRSSVKSIILGQTSGRLAG
jgi:DNA polymerase I